MKRNITIKELISRRFAPTPQAVENYFNDLEKPTIRHMRIIGECIGKTTAEATELFLNNQINLVK